MIEEIGRMIDSYLDNNNDWKRSQVDYVDDQGCEVVWHNEKRGWSIIHCQNYFTAPFYSIHSPRHVYKIGGKLGNTPWSLTFTYGHAPYKANNLVNS